jgi:Uma2 family endonuclease
MPPEPIRRFSLAEIHAIVQLGLLTEDDPYEFLDGWLLPKFARGPAHNYVASSLGDMLRKRLPAPWVVFSTGTITMPDSEPEPDLLVALGPIERYRLQYPKPHEVPLVVEVSDISLTRDRGLKNRIYARAGIAEYWIVNLIDRQIEVHTLPQLEGESPSYAQQAIYRPGQSVSVPLEGARILEIPVAELLPPA